MIRHVRGAFRKTLMEIHRLGTAMGIRALFRASILKKTRMTTSSGRLRLLLLLGIAAASALIPVEGIAGTAIAGAPVAKAPVQIVRTGLPEAFSPASLNVAKDPESEPLALYQQNHDTAVQTSNNALLRIMVSLLVVLGLFSVFAKLLLPKLVARYPEFFEKLKQQQQERRQKTSEKQAPTGEWRPQPKSMRGPMRDLPGLEPEDRITISPTFAQSRLIGKTNMKSSKQDNPARFALGGQHFQVVSSVDLGHGKELHLVEVSGRQLVVATTPDAVTLIKDLKDESPPKTDTENDNSNLPIHERYIDSLIPATKATAKALDGKDRQSDPDIESLQGVIPDQNTPNTPKSYASPPIRMPELPPVPSKTEPKPAEQVYLKYLYPEGDSSRSSQQQIRQIQQELGYVDDTTAAHSDMMEASDVVILDDYDDIYRK
jgi:flagellar biogenesis protein FliO